MEWLEPFCVLLGAVFLAWLLIELRDGNARNIRRDIGRCTRISLIPLGLLVGWTVKSVTGNYSILVMFVLAGILTLITEVSRMF
jgi:hypothetical protein